MSYPYFDKLASKKLYDGWNDGEKIRGYFHACLNLPSDLKNYIQIDNLCRRLARNLYDMQFFNHEKYYSYGRCKLLNYWLYEKVKEIIGNSPAANYKKPMESLHSEWNVYNKNYILYIPEDQKCKPDTTILNLIDIEDEKRIHEHCVDYHEIINKSDKTDECQKYEEHIKGISSKYYKLESILNADKENCPIYYDTCMKYNPKTISDISNCGREATSHANPSEKLVPEWSPFSMELRQKSFKLSPGETQFSDQKGKGLPTSPLVGLSSHPKEELPSPPDAELPSPPDTELPSPPDAELPTPPDTEERGLMSGVAVGSETSLEVEQGDVVLTTSEPEAPNSSVMPIGLSLFGIASFSTILYKFTPLRSVFYKLIHKNKSPINHHHEVPEELLEYMVTSGSNNRDNRPNYIAYHPA